MLDHFEPSETLGLIGVGLLGTALAERFLKAGYAICGFDVSPARRAALQDLAGAAAESADEVARRSHRIVLCLPNSEIVESVITQVLPQLSAGSLIIDTTTGDPDRTAALGARLAQEGISYLDATVAGSSEQVRRGEVIVMAGGTEAGLAGCSDLLGAFARQLFHVGPWGSGARMKLVVNLVLGLNRAVLAEGLSLARAAGLDDAATLAVLKASPAYSTVMETKGHKMLAGDFAPEARLAQHLKDVRLILDLGRRVGAGLPLSECHQELLERVVSLGWAAADNSAVIQAYQNQRASPDESSG